MPRVLPNLWPANNQVSLSHKPNNNNIIKTEKQKNSKYTQTMSQPRFTPTMIFLCLSLVLFHTHLPISNVLSIVDLNLLKQTEMDAVVVTRRVCNKSIGECLTDPEMMMDSETNRRVLAMQKKYISYGTLKRDMVPCDRAGASYYNCHARQANPYGRGCEVITACARGAQEIKTW